MNALYGEVPENAHEYVSGNSPWTVEDFDGTAWNEETGMPVVTNRERYYTPGSI